VKAARTLLLTALALTLTADTARGEDTPGLSYLYDGGALPLFWVPLAGRLALDQWVQPPAQPRWFSAREGGATPATWENPGWVVTATGGAVALTIALAGDDSRYRHAKGLAETLATGSLLTAAIKVTFGRHRPDYAGPGVGKFGGQNRSFLSGHSVQAFEIATYAALYLHHHPFADGTAAWQRGAAYGGLYAAAALVAAERVYHRRHHLSDVIAGATLGTIVAAAIFGYQEARGGAADGSAAPLLARWAWAL
jgi:membrane-associated phospholipid phosphatase